MIAQIQGGTSVGTFSSANRRDASTARLSDATDARARARASRDARTGEENALVVTAGRVGRARGRDARGEAGCRENA